MKSNEIKMIYSLCMCVLAIVLYIIKKGELRRKCMGGMVISSMGDFFMVDILGLGGISTYPGAAFFMLAHVIYGLAFIKEGKKKGYKFFNSGFKAGIIFVLVLTIALAVLAFTVPEKPETLMFFLILIYIAIITFNLVCQFSYASSEKGARWMLVVAMALFIISDFIIFLNMLAITPAHNKLVWATYIPAQVLITIFNSPLKKAN